VELSLGRRADYAIRATLDLAEHHGGERRKAREIGEAMAVPTTYLPQILALLVRAGIAESVAGPHGGYGLARAAEDLTILDVVTAVDGEVNGKRCVLRGGPCRWDDRCAVHESWSRAQQAMLGELAATTFAELVAEDRRLSAVAAGGPAPQG
jgi:Rrf2 family transcriptional regulator, iron-sulfur cluster assembly transcription factor